MDRSTLRHHARPGGRYEQVVAGWLGLRRARAVVSHESALEQHDLSDVIPAVVHVSIPRAKRGQRPRPGVRVHTVEQAPGRSEVTTVHGVLVTTPERSIVDYLEAG